MKGGDDPVIESLSVTANGTYTAGEGVDGYSPVTVALPLTEKTITENGIYAPTASAGYDMVNVNVPFYPREDVPLELLTSMESVEMHTEPTIGTRYYPIVYLAAIHYPAATGEEYVNVGKYFAPTDANYSVTTYIDIIDKETGESVEGFPQRTNTGASFGINSGGYIRLKGWYVTVSNNHVKVNVITTRWNTTYSKPLDDTYATQTDLETWLSAYTTPPYVIYSDIDTQYAVGDIIYPAGQPIILPPTADRAHSIVGIRIYGTANGVGVDASTDPYIQHGGTVSGYIAPVSSVIGSSGRYFYAELGNSQLSTNEHIDVFNLVNNYTGAPTTVATACDALANVKIEVEGRRDEYNRFIHAPFSFIYEVT